MTRMQRRRARRVLAIKCGLWVLAAVILGVVVL